MNRRKFIKGSTAAAGATFWAAAQNRNAASRQAEYYSGISRPQTLDMNGVWNMKEDPSERGEAQEWFQPGRVRGREARVPLPWQLAFDDLQQYSGTVWYEKGFQLPVGFAQKRIVIVFEAVDHAASVWLNGKFVGAHEGGQTPFLLDITQTLNPTREKRGDGEGY